MKAKPRWVWIEQYIGCGCSSEANRKRDLLGYCSKHGSSRQFVYKLPTITKEKS